MKNSILLFSIFYLVLLSNVAIAESDTNEGTPNIAPLESKELLLAEKEDISTGRRIAGGLLGTFYGFGSGHGVIGRWSEKGWIFTTLEVSSLALIINGIATSKSGSISDTMLVGLLVFSYSRIWEIVDVWTITQNTSNNSYLANNLRIGFTPLSLNNSEALQLTVQYEF